MTTPLRNEKGHWLPGQSAHPGGRPKSLEKLVRERVAAQNGGWEAMTDVMQAIVLGLPLPGASTELVPKIRDRIEAYKVLADRGHGKAKVTIDLAHDVTKGGLAGIDVDALDDAAFEVLDQAIENAIRGGRKVIDAVSTEAPEMAEALPGVHKPTP